MKIFISSQLFYPSKLGGPANAVYWLAKALVKSGHQVSVVTTHISVNNAVPTDEWITLDGIRVIYCSGKGFPYINIIKTSYSEIKTADIVLLTSVCYKPEIILAQSAIKLGKPVGWSPRGEFSKSAINNRADKKIFFSFIKKFLVSKISIHVTSEAERDDARSVLGGKVNTLLIPNYMELPQPVLPSVSEDQYLLFLGRIAPIKALDKLIKGVALSQKFRQSSVKLKIVGVQESQFKDYYLKLSDLINSNGLADKVSFEAPLFGEDKFKALCSALFLVLVSESENFGNVVIEALSQSTPVISSHGTPWEILEEANAGYWIDNTPESIAKTIDKVLELDNTDYSQMRLNASNLAKSFDIYENIEQWNNALDIIHKHKK